MLWAGLGALRGVVSGLTRYNVRAIVLAAGIVFLCVLAAVGFNRLVDALAAARTARITLALNQQIAESAERQRRKEEDAREALQRVSELEQELARQKGDPIALSRDIVRKLNK